MTRTSRIVASLACFLVGTVAFAQGNCQSQWTPRVFTTGGVGGSVYASCTYDDGTGTVYIGGLFQTAGGLPAANIASWNGVWWSTLGAGVSGSVFALAVYDDGTGPALYATGNFTSAGGIPANGIAKFNGLHGPRSGPGSPALRPGLASDRPVMRSPSTTTGAAPRSTSAERSRRPEETRQRTWRSGTAPGRRSGWERATPFAPCWRLTPAMAWDCSREGPSTTPAESKPTGSRAGAGRLVRAGVRRVTNWPPSTPRPLRSRVGRWLGSRALRRRGFRYGRRRHRQQRRALPEGDVVPGRRGIVIAVSALATFADSSGTALVATARRVRYLGVTCANGTEPRGPRSPRR